MILRNRREQLLNLAVDNYLSTYLERRDAAGTFAMLTPTMSGFGTGAAENGVDFDSSVKLYTKDFEQAPNSIEYDVIDRTITLVTPKVGLAKLRMHMKTVIEDQTAQFNYSRMSLMFVWIRGKWFLEHIHVSLPTTAHGENEAYPVVELERRAAVLERMVARRTGELEEARRRLEQQATTDSLTGVYNRAKADELLRIEMARAERSGAPLSVLLVDVDHFKQVNDTLGHSAGDRVLRSFSRLLCDHARQTDYVARWGGEEFLIICPGTGKEEAGQLAERLRTRVESHRFSREINVTASIGVSELRPADTREELVSRADGAMYRAKDAGRNRVDVD